MSAADTASCSDIVGELDELLDKQLPRERSTLFVTHIAGCDDCQRYIESYQATRTLLLKAAIARLPGDSDADASELASQILQHTKPHH